MGIPLAALGINQQPGPLEQVGKALQLKSLQQNQQYQAQAQPLELQQRQQAVEEAKYQTAARDAANKAYQGALTVDENGQPKFDSAAVTKSLSAAGFGAEAPTILEHMQKFEQGKATLEQTHANTQKLQSEAQTHQQDMMGNMGAAIKAAGNDPAMADTFLQHMEMTPDMPPEGKQRIEQLRQQMKQNPAMVGQMADNWISQSPAQQKRQLEQAKEAETARHNKAMEEKTPTTEAGLAAKAASGDAQAEAALKRLDQSKIASRPIIGAIPGPALSDTAKDQAAEKYWQTGQLPQGNRGAAGMIQNRGIMNRAAELHPTGSLAANSAEYKANSAALSKVQTQSDTVEAFENTALKNLDQVLKAAEAIPDVGVKFLNTPIRAFDSKVIGTENMARLNAALLTGRTESARVLNSANATGVLTNEARGEVEQILSGNMTYPAMKAAINQLKVDMGNRKQSYRDQIADIKGRLGGGSAAPAAAPAPGGYQPLPSFKEWDAQRKAQAKP